MRGEENKCNTLQNKNSVASFAGWYISLYSPPQFIIATGPRFNLKHLDGAHVVFGGLVKGWGQAAGYGHMPMAGDVSWLFVFVFLFFSLFFSYGIFCFLLFFD